MSLTINDMPGATPEAKSLQFEQWQRREALYAARRAAPVGQEYTAPSAQKALADYEATVVALGSLLGPDAPCSQVDCDLWGEFSDFYKDVIGFRPRGMPFTRQTVLEWIFRHSQPQAA